MFQPQIADKAGRGSLCARIDQITKDMMECRPTGEKPDHDKFNRLTVLLGEARRDFHRLYAYRPGPSLVDGEIHG